MRAIVRPGMKAPRRRHRSARAHGLARATLLLLLVACGSRTGLWGTDDDVDELEPDGGRDAGHEAHFIDARDQDEEEPDAPLPPIDATPRDANRTDCPDADATLVYVVTQANELYSFFPTDGSFKFISNLACPTPTTPFSMAVDRRGVAYVEFEDDGIYRVSTATGACIATSFVPDQHGFKRFGMGFATNTVGPTETLFVSASADTSGATDLGLARIDPTSLVLDPVGPFFPRDLTSSELTGTGDGRLYAFYTKGGVQGSAPSFIGEINTDTAEVVAETAFPTVAQGNGWAFAFWGGDFYMFTGTGGSSTVTRWRPLDDSVTVVANLPSLIVGAGVSTCAPSQ
jgi:hypothetical protein